jgi:hypothetical protein
MTVYELMRKVNDGAKILAWASLEVSPRKAIPYIGDMDKKRACCMEFWEVTQQFFDLWGKFEPDKDTYATYALLCVFRDVVGDCAGRCKRYGGAQYYCPLCYDRYRWFFNIVVLIEEVTDSFFINRWDGTQFIDDTEEIKE